MQTVPGIGIYRNSFDDLSLQERCPRSCLILKLRNLKIYKMRTLLYIMLFCFGLSLNAAAQKGAATKQLWGVFDSKKGVMDPISCYGYNIGYFDLYTTEEAVTKVICFDRMKNGENLQVSCNEGNSITVWGYYETISLDSGTKGACSGGAREVFFVTKWECYN